MSPKTARDQSLNYLNYASKNITVKCNLYDYVFTRKSKRLRYNISTWKLECFTEPRSYVFSLRSFFQSSIDLHWFFF